MSEQNPEMSLEIQVAAFRAEITRIKNELKSVDGTIRQVDVNTLNEQHMGVWLRYKNILKEMNGVLEEVTEENIDEYERQFKELKKSLHSLGQLNDTVDSMNSNARKFSDWMRNQIAPLSMNIFVLLSKSSKHVGMIEEIRADVKNNLDYLSLV